jgi:hypothetical protein
MWEPKHEKTARLKARAVAKFIHSHRATYGNTPIYYYIAKHFNRSTTWVTNYVRLARQWGYL